MPARNTLRFYDAPAFYHIYNRGANKSDIFRDDMDREKFLSLLERYLDPTIRLCNRNNEEYPKYDAEINAYCLMDNHFHFLAYQQSEPDAISGLMKSLTTAYTMYFNRKYRHQGTIFQGVFRAVRITDESYLMHISRYIHMNPHAYIAYPWSSVVYYLGQPAPNWLKPDRIRDSTPGDYRAFLHDYDGKKAELAILKNELADQ